MMKFVKVQDLYVLTIFIISFRFAVTKGQETQRSPPYIFFHDSLVLDMLFSSTGQIHFL